MPQPYWREHMRIGNRYPLREAARAGQIVVVKCTSCRRVVNYLAADLLQFLDPGRDVRFPLFPCGKCRTEEYLHFTLRIPSAGDYGHLVIRRPAGVQIRRLWRDVPLGD